jgi:hypothetical protein
LVMLRVLIDDADWTIHFLTVDTRTGGQANMSQFRRALQETSWAKFGQS